MGRRVKHLSVKTLLIIGVIVILILLFVTMNGKSNINATVDNREIELSAWITDWQWKDGVEDFKNLKEVVSSVQVFAAYFNANDELFYTKENLEAIPEIIAHSRSNENSSIAVYLSIVNDRFENTGPPVQKDTSLLTRLMESPESRSKHIEDIMDMMAKYDFTGIEIDYENIGDEDWDNMCLFYKELYQKLFHKDKKLRIILEPKAQIDNIKLPEGPDYVLMAYNLYGSHSGPGPKADYEFIRKMAKQLDALSGEHFIAFSTGGFVWNEFGEVVAVTEKEAILRLEKSVIPPKRDDMSGAVYFDYLDEQNTKNIVWYADDVTLEKWIDVSREAGNKKVALWRTGGFEQKTIDYFNRLIK